MPTFYLSESFFPGCPSSRRMGLYEWMSWMWLSHDHTPSNYNVQWHGLGTMSLLGIEVNGKVPKRDEVGVPDPTSERLLGLAHGSDIKDWRLMFDYVRLCWDSCSTLWMPRSCAVLVICQCLAQKPNFGIGRGGFGLLQFEPNLTCFSLSHDAPSLIDSTRDRK